MTPLVPLALFGWVGVTVVLFFTTPTPKAILISVIGGFLLLPWFSYNLPGIPSYDKSTAIALGLLLGGRLSGSASKERLRLTFYDVPMLLWCFVVPLASSLSNGLGLRDGMSGAFGRFFSWGAFFWAGRKYFGTPSSIRLLALGVLAGGLLYLPLVLFEVRMSPQLSNIVYGFFPHSFLQHIRYGGYRPIVFMQHGLMVSLWMAASAICALWLWRMGEIRKLCSIPMFWIVVSLFAATILCKSANAWIFLFLGTIAMIHFKMRGNTRLVRLLALLIPVYIAARLSGRLLGESVEAVASLLFDEDRIGSLGIRLVQENLFGARALEHPLFGWGGYGRGWPLDPITGGWAVPMVDALWVIVLSSNGLLGLLSLFLALGLGPWRGLGLYRSQDHAGFQQADSHEVYGIVLSLIVIFFLLDSLVNAMVNPIYILCAGALVSYYLGEKERRMAITKPTDDSTHDEKS